MTDMTTGVAGAEHPLRLGLALSGGGTRAAVFHLGLLLRLATAVARAIIRAALPGDCTDIATNVLQRETSEIRAARIASHSSTRAGSASLSASARARRTASGLALSSSSQLGGSSCGC